MNILLATDGSDCARVAGELLAGLPLPAESRVTILSVVPGSAWLASAPIGGEAGLYPWLADFHKEEDRTARCTAEAAADLLRERGIDAHVSIRRQSPAEGILEQAREEHADLILLGSHGKGTVERFLVGSVSERVARCASAAVLVVHGSAVRRVIVGVDGSESSEQALDALRRLPLPAEAEIRVLHALHEERIYPVPIVPGVRMESVFESYDRERRAEGERIVRHARSRLGLRGPAATTALHVGPPADVLIDTAREWEADLLVVGTHNRSALGRLFLGSVSARVLSHAPCSVLIARAPEEPGVPDAER